MTQGLEWHGSAAAPTYYELIAGKDTLVRAVLSSEETPVLKATCTMSHGPSASLAYAAHLIPLSISATGGTRHRVSCWIPGTDVAQPGGRSFEVTAFTRRGSQRIPLGIGRVFLSSKDLRLMVMPWIFPSGHPEYLPWNDQLALNVAESMQELNRRFPLRTGVGNFSLNGTGEGGVRYMLSPMPYVCERRPSEGIDQANGRCNAEQRAIADQAIRLYNLGAGTPDADRFDLAWAPVTTPSTGGGQSCWGSQRSFGTGLDPDFAGGSATSLIHEIAHCMGQVSAASPNRSGMGGHARVWDIEMDPTIPLVDMRTRQVLGRPVSLMNGAVAHVFNTYLEAFEWNVLRRALLGRSGLLAQRGGEEIARLASNASGRSLVAQLPPSSDGSAMFTLAGTMSRNGDFSVLYSGRIEDFDTSILSTAEQQPSDYSLVFYDKDGTAVGLHRFNPVFDTPDGKTDTTGVSIVAPMPLKTARVAVERSGKPLYVAACGSAAPAVHDAKAALGSNGLLTMTWAAKHPNNRELRYSIEFARHQDERPVLLMAGIRGDSWQGSSSVLPGTTDGAFTISASDGCLIARTKVTLPRIEGRAPAARIRIHKPDASASNSDQVTATATAWDHTDGVLSGGALQWYADGRQVGVGTTVALDPTTKVVSLVVTNSAGLQTRVSEKVP